MSFTTPRSWLLMSALLFGYAAVASAQLNPSSQHWGPGELTPFAPVDHEQDMRPFAPPDLSEYGNGPKPNEGFFFQYDRLFWAFTGPKVSPIGDPLAPTTTITPSGQVITLLNSLDTSFITTDYIGGNRYELGYVVDDRGWLGSVISVHNQERSINGLNTQIAFNDPLGIGTGFIDQNGDGFDDDLNGNLFFGRDGLDFNPVDGIPDLFGPTDFADQIDNPIIFTLFSAQSITKLSGVEVMRIWRLPKLHYGGTFEWLFGLRFVNITDQFFLHGLGGDTLFALDINTEVQNYIIGPQFGARWAHKRGRWTLSAEGRFAAAANFQQVDQFGGVIATPSGQLPNLRSTDFNQATTDTEWAPVGELRLETQLQLTKAISLRMGYNGMIVGGVTRASRRVDYSLPDISILDGNRNDEFIVNGFNLGFEINR